MIQVLAELESKPGKEANEALRETINYLSKREKKGQLDNRKELGENLPVGSGEVESAHRHLLPKRLKISGAWWCLERAEEVAQLRAMRANYRWNEFWEQKGARP